MGKSKVTEIIVYSWEDADIQMPAEVFSHIMRYLLQDSKHILKQFYRKKKRNAPKELKIMGKN